MSLSRHLLVLLVVAHLFSCSFLFSRAMSHNRSHVSNSTIIVDPWNALLGDLDSPSTSTQVLVSTTSSPLSLVTLLVLGLSILLVVIIVTASSLYWCYCNDPVPIKSGASTAGQRASSKQHHPQPKVSGEKVAVYAKSDPNIDRKTKPSEEKNDNSSRKQNKPKSDDAMSPSVPQRDVSSILKEPKPSSNSKGDSSCVGESIRVNIKRAQTAPNLKRKQSRQRQPRNISPLGQHRAGSIRTRMTTNTRNTHQTRNTVHTRATNQTKGNPHQTKKGPSSRRRAQSPHRQVSPVRHANIHGVPQLGKRAHSKRRHPAGNPGLRPGSRRRKMPKTGHSFGKEQSKNSHLLVGSNTRLEKESLGFYQRFLKSLHTVKSVSQYMENHKQGKAGKENP